MNRVVCERMLAIGLGSSLGDRRRHLDDAVRALDRTHGMALVRCSRLVRTPPMQGGTATGWFLNAVALFRTTLGPHAVLARCRDLEAAAGRRRSRFWGDRTLDLDLVLDEVYIVDDAELRLPHPSLGARRFVVEPLLEVWPDARDPRTGELIATIASATGPKPVPVGVFARG